MLATGGDRMKYERERIARELKREALTLATAAAVRQRSTRIGGANGGERWKPGPVDGSVKEGRLVEG